MATTDPFGFEIPDDEYAAYLDELAERERDNAQAEQSYTEWLDQQEAEANARIMASLSPPW